MAIKFNEDINYKTSFYAKIGGVSTNELIIIETEFFEIVEFNLFVDSKTFYSYCNFYKIILERKNHNALDEKVMMTFTYNINDDDIFDLKHK